MVEIKTKRLVLRHLADDDAKQITLIINDYELSRWLISVPYPYTLTDARNYISGMADNWRFGITSNDQLIGVVGLNGGLGYWLGQSYWGNGYMTEAVEALINKWVEENDSLMSGHFIGNIASKRILEKMGFSPTYLEKCDCLAQNKSVDIQRMVLTKERWLENA